MTLQMYMVHPGLINMLLDYKYKMAEDSSDDGPLEFEDIRKYILDVDPEDEKNGQLMLITAGRRVDGHLNEYAKEVLGFDWQDFYLIGKGNYTLNGFANSL